ncbi:MAG: bifunctional [glutamate--ammonia ligase]-adenylyl-L-tyrosine phosphorylase/[glutamate--ammonia-ligase] adenylyltransferase, partial [Burkholderiales bacterium]
ARLHELGYTNGERVLTRIGQLRESALFRRMSASTQGRLDALGPRIVEAACKVPNPDITFERLLNILESIGRREAYLALLLEYAGARERVVHLASASPWAASYLARHPVLLDELVSDRQPEPPDWTALGKELRATLDQSGDGIERQMDLLRNFKQVHTFRLLIQDLAGQLPLESLSDHLSDLASTIVQEVLRLCWSYLNSEHAPRFAVIGYGKWGGKELGYASDLDLIFLYDADDALERYTRLAQRVNTWLTTFTPAGILYDIDLRLRPDGDAGMLVSHIGAFEEYQLHKAWVFEHQAMTRARFVAGDAQIGARFEALRQKILTTPRDLSTLRGEIASMRQRMLEGHPNKSGLFDIKHDRGGIVDVEFIVQYLVLGYAHQYPQLTGNIGNLALLKLAASLGLILSELASAVHHSYREFRRMQHSMRLQDERYARTDPSQTQPLVAPVLALWQAVFD